MPFVIVALTLFASLLAADAQVDAAASDGPESVRVERVLTAGQIDSSTVDVGALAVVVYEQGERHPISGAWTQLDTVRGSIKAVDSRRLIVGLEPDGWSKWIALERIQTLSLIGAPFSSSADRDHTHTRTTKRVQPAQTAPEVARSDSLSEQMEAMVKRYYTKADNREALRISKKLAAGVMGGVAGGLAGAAIIVGVDSGEFGNELPALLGFWGGNLVGTPVGVSAFDLQDNFLITLARTLAGSALLGVGVPYAIAIISAKINSESEAGGKLMILSGLLGPIAGATIASEVWRKPPEAGRVPVSMVPDPKGGLSAVATLRF